MWTLDTDVAKPTAPASMASATMPFISATSAGVAARSVASSPITDRRTGVCPTMTATLIPSG